MLQAFLKVNIFKVMNSLLDISFLRIGIYFFKFFKKCLYSQSLKTPTTFLTTAAAQIPIKTLRIVMDINFVDKAKTATPAAPLIAAHLNFLKLYSFFVFAYEYPRAAIDAIVPTGSP